MDEISWASLPNFQKSEFLCSETGECQMQTIFMQKLQEIRTIYNKPMIISSGYRSMKHSAERDKPKPVEHTHGLAVDVLVSGLDAIELLHIAITRGITRIGVQQSGNVSTRYLHLGMGDKLNLFPSAIWTY